MSNKIKILLTVSIVLNFFFIGIFIGQFSEDFTKHKRWKDNIEKNVDKLPPEKAELVKKTMWSLHSKTRETKKEIRKTRKNIAKIIQSPEFSETEFDSEIQKLHKLQGQIMSEFAEATKGLASKFRQEERKVIAEILQKKHRRSRHFDQSGIKPPPGLDQPPPF